MFTINVFFYLIGHMNYKEISRTSKVSEASKINKEIFKNQKSNRTDMGVDRNNYKPADSNLKDEKNL